MAMGLAGARAVADIAYRIANKGNCSRRVLRTTLRRGHHRSWPVGSCWTARWCRQGGEPGEPARGRSTHVLLASIAIVADGDPRPTPPASRSAYGRVYPLSIRLTHVRCRMAERHMQRSLMD